MYRPHPEAGAAIGAPVPQVTPLNPPLEVRLLIAAKIAYGKYPAGIHCSKQRASSMITVGSVLTMSPFPTSIRAAKTQYQIIPGGIVQKLHFASSMNWVGSIAAIT